MLPQGLIVSCQALPEEPLHSSFIMSKMALAAYQGGAVGIRANSIEDIVAIGEEITSKEVNELIESGCEVIALDATKQKRPKEPLEELVKYIREKAPDIEIMADISTIEEAIYADQLGFDYIGTTLRGYTPYTKGHILYENDFEFLKEVLNQVNTKVIAEGNVITPDMYKKVNELGVHCTVVGGAITRPKQITERFVEAVKNHS